MIELQQIAALEIFVPDIVWTPVTTTLGSLIPWDRNPKTISKGHAKRLLDLWDKLGQFQTLAIGPSGEVYDGHQRLSVLKAAYGARFQVQALQSSRSLTEQEREELTISAHVGTTGTWDWDALSGWDESVLRDGGFDPELLRNWNTGAVAVKALFESEEPATRTREFYAKDQVLAAAFAWFRAHGFPYRNIPPHVCMQEINALLATDSATLVHTNTGYQVADTYHPHRFHGSVETRRSVVDAFLDDRLLRKALDLELTYGRIGHQDLQAIKLVSGTQSLSNFRPGYAAYIYRSYCPVGGTVLDSSTGYGGRLVGFIGSGVGGRYIGIDPNTQTHAGNMRMANDLMFAGMVELHNLPAEDVPHSLVAGRCDFSFTSPPYFCKERYSNEETQSWIRYATGDAWKAGFLRPMMALQHVALKSGCLAVVNIEDIVLNGKTYPLVRWTIEAGEAAGFSFVERKEMPLSRRFGGYQSGDVATESVLFFRKGKE